MQQDDTLTRGNTRFWEARTLDELVQSQSAPVVTNLASLKAEFWPEDETAEDINQFIVEQRQADRLRDK